MVTADEARRELARRELARRRGAAPEGDASRETRQTLSEYTQNPAWGQYDTLPEWQKPIVAASDVGQLTAQGAATMFGLNPEKGAAWLRSSVGGGSYEDELAEQQRMTAGARNRSGWAGTAAEITGAAAGPVKLAGKGITLAGRAGTEGMKGLKGLLARSAIVAPEAAIYGAANAYANDQDVGTGAMIGAAGGVGGNLLGEGISAGVNKVAGAFNKSAPVPSVDDLKAAGSAAFKRAEAEGVMFNPNGVNRLRTNIIKDMTNRGFDPANEPGVMPIIKRLEAMGSGNVTFEGLNTLRRVAQNGYRPGMNSNNDAVRQIVERIDEFVDAADPSTVLMGRNPQAAAEAVKEARKHWHTARKLETVEALQQRGQHMANSNVLADEVGSTKKQLRTILTNKGKSRGFSEVEMKAVEKAAGYTPTQRVLHAASGLMPRDKLSTAVHMAAGGPTAFATGGASLPVQAGLMATGWAAQKVNESLAKKSVAELTRLIANGGIPPAEVQNLMQRLAHSKRETLSRVLMAIAQNRGNAWYNAPSQEPQP